MNYKQQNKALTEWLEKHSQTARAPRPTLHDSIQQRKRAKAAMKKR